MSNILCVNQLQWLFLKNIYMSCLKTSTLIDRENITLPYYFEYQLSWKIFRLEIIQSRIEVVIVNRKYLWAAKI